MPGWRQCITPRWPADVQPEEVFLFAMDMGMQVEMNSFDAKGLPFGRVCRHT